MWEKLEYCCFISVYSYSPGQWVVIDKIFTDLDDDRKPEHALTDSRVIIDWAEDEGLQVVTVFSGNKGYHNYILLKPQLIDIRKVEDTGPLKIKLRCVLNWLAARGWEWRYLENGKLDHEYAKDHISSLRTLDPRIRGDYRRITRVPGYKYVKYHQSEYFPKDSFCNVVPPEMVKEWSHQEIVEYCKESRPYKPTLDPFARLITLDELVEEFNIQPENWLWLSGSDSRPEYGIYKGEYSHPNTEVIKNIFPKMCIHNDLLGNPEPKHITRFYAAVMLLNYYGWEPAHVVKFFAEDVSWSDFNEGETKTQVYQIHGHIPRYLPPSCSTLKMWGLCVKDKCPKYRRTNEG
jgi:hypothetical protein